LWQDLRPVVKSLTYIKNKRGPRVDPCGTPQVRGRIFDLMLLIIVYWVLFDK